LKLNGIYQLLVYADNILGVSVHTVKKNTGALIVASKGIRLEGNADKTKYMLMSLDQNAGRSHNMTIDNGSSERVEQFKYLGTTLRIKILFRKKLKSRLKSGNAPVIRCRFLCLPVCCPKIQMLRYTEL